MADKMNSHGCQWRWVAGTPTILMTWESFHFPNGVVNGCRGITMGIFGRPIKNVVDGACPGEVKLICVDVIGLRR